jgi:hypothetical protein
MPPAAMTGTSTAAHTWGQQHDRGHRSGALEPSSLAAFDDQSVDTGVHRLERGPQGRHDVEDGDPHVEDRG